MLIDISPEIIFKLSRLLNPESINNWRRVASELGYSQVDINNFGINKDCAFQTLMQNWATLKGSTVFKLYNIFLNMKRDDCATVLEDVLLAENV